MQNRSQLKIGVVLSYVTSALQMIISLTYTPVMIHLLGQSEYGLYILVGSFVSYLSLFSLGFGSSYLRFYSRYQANNDNEGIARLNGMFLSLFLFLSFLALVTGLILSQFTQQIFGSKLSMQELDEAKVLMIILVINIALLFPNTVFDSIISSKEQFLWQRIVNLVSIVINPFVCLPLLIAGYGSVMMVVVTTCITVAKLLLDLWYCLKKLHTKFIFRRFDKGLLKEMGNFSFFIFLNMIIDQINWSVDKLILSHTTGTTGVAIYGVGSHINSMFMQFSTSISSVFSPRVNRIAASNSSSMSNDFTELFIKIGRVQFLVLSLIASGVIFFGKYFITELYAGEKYGESYAVTLLLILPVMIPLIQNVGIEIQQSVNKHQFRSYVYLGMSLLNFAISIPLAQEFGPTGAALGTCISLLFANGLVMNLFYQKTLKINIKLFWKNILTMSKGLIIPVTYGILIAGFIDINSILLFFILVIVYSVIYFVSMYMFGTNDYERNLIKKPFSKLSKLVRRR